MRRPCLLSLLYLPTLLGCGPEPHQRMPAQAEAFALVRQHLLTTFAPDTLSEPDVRWWTETCPGTDRSAVVVGQRCFSGIYFRADGVDVAWRGSIGSSAYTHELMHYFLDHSGQDSDPLHLRGDIWAQVNQIDTELQDSGM